MRVLLQIIWRMGLPVSGVKGDCPSLAATTFCEMIQRLPWYLDLGRARRVLRPIIEIERTYL